MMLRSIAQVRFLKNQQQLSLCRLCHSIFTGNGSQKTDNTSQFLRTSPAQLIGKRMVKTESKLVHGIIEEKIKHEPHENPYTKEQITDEDPLVQTLFKGLVAGQRASLARSITLAESTHPKKRAQAQVLLSKILKHRHKVDGKSVRRKMSFRIGECCQLRIYCDCSMST